MKIEIVNKEILGGGLPNISRLKISKQNCTKYYDLISLVSFQIMDTEAQIWVQNALTESSKSGKTRITVKRRAGRYSFPISTRAYS